MQQIIIWRHFRGLDQVTLLPLPVITQISPLHSYLLFFSLGFLPATLWKGKWGRNDDQPLKVAPLFHFLKGWQVVCRRGGWQQRQWWPWDFGDPLGSMLPIRLTVSLGLIIGLAHMFKPTAEVLCHDFSVPVFWFGVWEAKLFWLWQLCYENHLILSLFCFTMWWKNLPFWEGLWQIACGTLLLFCSGNSMVLVFIVFLLLLLLLVVLLLNSALGLFIIFWREGRIQKYED